MKAFSIFCLVSLLISPVSFAKQGPEQIIFTRSFADDAYGHYHTQVLRRILALTPEFGNAEAVPHPQPMPQARQILKLQSGEGHIMWSATSDEREQQLLPVRFPLLQGLAGYRVLVIHKYKQYKFNADIGDDTLRSYLGVQGADWPDLTVLQYNGFKAEGSPWSLWFTSMFIAVEKGLVDYFPRNVLEVASEMARYQDRNIKIEDNLLLRYANYEYFFVSPNHPELVSRIQTGLLRMLTSGELQAYFTKHYEHANAMALATDPHRKIFDLDNPALTITFENPLWSETPQPMIEYLTSLVTAR